jgi:hypothetical protein
MVEKNAESFYTPQISAANIKSRQLKGSKIYRYVTPNNAGVFSTHKVKKMVLLKSGKLKELSSLSSKSKLKLKHNPNSQVSLKPVQLRKSSAKAPISGETQEIRPRMDTSPIKPFKTDDKPVETLNTQETNLESTHQIENSQKYSQSSKKNSMYRSHKSAPKFK